MTSGLLLWLAAAAVSAAAPTAGTVFKDNFLDAEIRYLVSEGRVNFSADLPAGWSFSISIDGDQNGRWGKGVGDEAGGVETSSDRTFGQDVRGSVFCAQYVFTAVPSNLNEIYMSSDCNGYSSKGIVELTQLDARGRATITYRIPAAEIFGGRRDARLRACVWDTKRWTCQHSLAQPFILGNPLLVPTG
jgi:hypothetical protein